MPTSTPVIPENITVHLGAPGSDAQNVTLSFSDYIKNVASSEIYPTWNESALRANILAQISYALNRVYVEYYRSRGYNYDITNSTAIDQKFINGRNIFENINELVDEIFDDYIRRQGFIEPLAAKYCNGTTVTCEGLSQWGSQGLAEQGLNSVEILKNYYGDDIELVIDAPIQNIEESYPGTPLRRGSTGVDVAFIQNLLNRISQNYPLIGKLTVDGSFGESTEDSVETFQQIFNLTADGIVGKATWYQLVKIYVGIKRLSELDSEGQTIFGQSLEYPDAIVEGETGEKVTILQYFLSVISEFYTTVPPIAVTGAFGPETKNAVIQFQKQVGIEQTGIVNAETWNEIYNAFKGIIDTVFLDEEVFAITTQPYGGTVLKFGSQGEDVRILQQYLNEISVQYPAITPITPTGIFGRQTRKSITDYQSRFGLPVTGMVDKEVWDSIVNTYKDILSAQTSRPLQAPQKTLKQGDSDHE